MDFSPIIVNLIKRTSKELFKFNDKIESLKQKFSKSCPSDDELKLIIEQKVKITQVLQSTLDSLESLVTLTKNIPPILKVLKTSIKVIKLIPIPAAVPPGIGLPINIVINLSDLLNILKLFIEKGSGSIGAIPVGLKSLVNIIRHSISLLESLDALILKCLEKKAIESNTSIEEIREEFSFSEGIIESQQIEEENEEELLQQLTDGYYYKGFKLIVEKNPPIYKLSPLRIRGFKSIEDGVQSSIIELYTYGGKYSYNPKVETLINEIKSLIDLYLLTKRN